MSRREALGAGVIRGRLAKLGRGPTFLELCIIRAGMLRAGQVALSSWWWATAVREHGDRATGEHLAQVGRVSRAQGFRYLRELREVFSGDELAQVVEFILTVRERAGLDAHSDAEGVSVVGLEPAPLVA